MKDNERVFQVRRALEEEKAKITSRYAWVINLEPFDYPDLDDMPLALLPKGSYNNNLKKTRIHIAFLEHLTNKIGLSPENVSEVRNLLIFISRPKVGEKLLIDTDLTVGDIRQFSNEELAMMHLKKEQVKIVKALFPRRTNYLQHGNDPI